MADQAQAKPVDSIRYGAVEGAIWRNQGEKGDFFNATFTRHYQDTEGNWKQTQGFRESDLPALAKAAFDLHSLIQTYKNGSKGQS